MKARTRQVLLTTLWLTWRLVWLPVVLAIKLVHLWSVRPLLQDQIVCRVCGEHLGVLGLWQCGGCGYSFYGFYFARCEECGAVPPYLDCESCGASTLNPMIFK